MLEVIEAPPPPFTNVGKTLRGRKPKPAPKTESVQDIVETPEDPAVEVPYVIQGSALMRTPLKTFDWIKP
jgi:hypothetical protein